MAFNRYAYIRCIFKIGLAHNSYKVAHKSYIAAAVSYWTSVGGASGVAEAFMYDGSYVKLRELSLGWSLPQKWLRNTPLKSVKISAVGRDLWFLFKNAPVNPESAFSRSDFAQAFEIGSMPPTRTMGFSLNVKF